MKLSSLLIAICLASPQMAFALNLPNCVSRIDKFKHVRLPVKKDELRNNTGCLFVINWGIDTGSKKPTFYDIRTSEECEKVGGRLEKAWKKSLLFKGDGVAHCQTRIQIKCPSRKRACRIIFQLPNGDPVFDASKANSVTP